MLRRVKHADMLLLFGWANDPTVRAQSFQQKPIKLDDHVAWFLNIVHDWRRLIFIAEIEDDPIGMIRFDQGDHTAEISIIVDKRHRNCGYGVKMINEGIKKYYEDYDIDRFIALIYSKNKASIAAFTKAGFIFTPECHDGTVMGYKVV